MTTIWDLFNLPFTDARAAYDLKRGFAYVMMCVFLVALVSQTVLAREEKPAGGFRGLDGLWGSVHLLRRSGRVFTGILVAGAVFLSASYFARAAPFEHYLHRWDAFHTVLGAKYHDELGYFDLYKCAIAVDRESGRHFRSVKTVRDLRTREFVPVREHLRGNDCEERFTPERLEEFKADLNTMGPSMRPHDWQRLFKDKGFNGTPFYTVVVTALMGVGGTTMAGLTGTALVDVGLMYLAFIAVGWAFGVRRAAIFAIFFCSFFPNRYVHMGGSILRFDYVAALAVALAAIKKDRWGIAGVLMAWATMVRIFPILFAGGVFLKILADVLLSRRWDRKFTFFTAAFTGCLALFLVISFVGLEGGTEDWMGWWNNMQVHNSKSASFRIGFRHLFMFDGSLERVHYGNMQKAFLSRLGPYIAAVALLFSPLIVSIRRLNTVTFTALFGTAAFFLLVVSTRYYYSVIALVFLVDRDILRNRTLLLCGALLFGASAFDFFYFEIYDNTPLMYNFIIGAQMTAFLLVLGFGLLFDPGLEERFEVFLSKEEPEEARASAETTSDQEADADRMATQAEAGSQALPTLTPTS